MTRRHKFSVIIADDEQPATALLQSYFERCDDFDVVASCDSVEQAVDAIQRHRPNVVFLDIQIQNMSGFDIINRIGVAEMPSVVFVTARRQHALEAFEVHAFDYLVKPVTKKRFDKCIWRLRHHLQSTSRGDEASRLEKVMAEPRLKRITGQTQRPDDVVDRFVVQERGRLITIPVDKIIWIEAQQHYVEFHTAAGSHLYRESISRIEKLLDDTFVRVHRSTIVNSKYVSSLESQAGGDYVVVLTTGTRLKVSRRRREALARLLSLIKSDSNE